MRLDASNAEQREPFRSVLTERIANELNERVDIDHAVAAAAAPL